MYSVYTSCWGTMKVNMFVLAYGVLVMQCLLLANFHGTNALLSTSFYANSCPSLQFIVANAVAARLQQDHTAIGPVLRMFFHDCFVRVYPNLYHQYDWNLIPFVLIYWSIHRKTIYLFEWNDCQGATSSKSHNIGWMCWGIIVSYVFVECMMDVCWFEFT